jgi:hypothetical protein
MNDQLVKILKGAAIAGGGAAITFALEALPTVDFGTWTPMVTALCSIGIQIVRKLTWAR